MSDIVLLPDDLGALLPDPEPRSAGLHAKAIIDDLAMRLGYLKQDVQLTTTWAQFGQLWEWAAITMQQQRCPGRYARLGEIEHDGIYLTPDLHDLEDWAVEEFKLKWMSSAHDIEGEKFWRDWCQIQAYCYVTESGIGRLKVFHTNGDWRGEGPVYKPWERRFKSQELREVWRMIKRHGEDNRERLEEGRQAA